MKKILFAFFFLPLLVFSQSDGVYFGQVWFGDEDGIFDTIRIELNNGRARILTEPWSQLQKDESQKVGDAIIISCKGQILITQNKIEANKINVTWQGEYYQYTVKEGTFIIGGTTTPEDNNIYTFVNVMPEFSGGTLSFQNEILSEMVTNTLIPKENYRATIIVNKDKSIVVKKVAVSGGNISNQVNGLVSAIIESKSALNYGMQNDVPVRVEMTLFLKLKDFKPKQDITNGSTKEERIFFSSPSFMAYHYSDKINKSGGQDSKSGSYSFKQEIIISSDKKHLKFIHYECNWHGDGNLNSVDTIETVFKVVSIENKSGAIELTLDLQYQNSKKVYFFEGKPLKPYESLQKGESCANGGDYLLTIQTGVKVIEKRGNLKGFVKTSECKEGKFRFNETNNFDTEELFVFFTIKTNKL